MAWTGYADLSRGVTTVVSTSAEELDRFLGGRGLGASLLFRMSPPDLDPLSPAAPLIFATGALTGTAWPASARGHVTFRSPLTGIYGYANSGGHFWAALAQAGFDALLITGQAPQPVALEVSPGELTVRPVPELWGATTSATAERLTRISPGRVACIGQAGENGVRIAGIVNDGSRAAARCGGGAVMGSKRLKAIVVRGQGRITTPRDFARVAGEAARKLRHAPTTQGLMRLGTPLLVKVQNAAGTLPTHNHQAGQFPFADQIDAEALERYLVRHRACHACPIACDRITRVEEGPYATELGGPEYETIDSLGARVGLSDPEALIYANRLCNDLGLDTISTGATIAFAMECHQRGLLSDSDLSLEWGDTATVLGLVRAIAARQGIGDLLAEGTRAAAAVIGAAAQPLAMQVKGLEMPCQDPRIAKGFGLGHATSNRGADHLYALPTIDLAGNWEAARRFFPAEILPALMDTAEETYKPDLIVFTEHYCAVSDALGVCKFSTAETYGLMPEDLAEGLSMLRGRAITAEALLLAGERIVNLERLYNVRLGLSRADDRLPDRFTMEPLAVYALGHRTDESGVEGSAQPVRIGRLQGFAAMLDRYYRLRGWDEQGRPSPERLRALDLDGLAVAQTGRTAT